MLAIPMDLSQVRIRLHQVQSLARCMEISEPCGGIRPELFLRTCDSAANHLGLGNSPALGKTLNSGRCIRIQGESSAMRHDCHTIISYHYI